MQTAIDTALQGSVASTRDALARLPIRVVDRHVLPLSRVADLAPIARQPQIAFAGLIEVFLAALIAGLLLQYPLVLLAMPVLVGRLPGAEAITT